MADLVVAVVDDLLLLLVFSLLLVVIVVLVFGLVFGLIVPFLHELPRFPDVLFPLGAEVVELRQELGLES